MDTRWNIFNHRKKQASTTGIRKSHDIFITKLLVHGRIFIIFCRIWICKKNYSFSWVVFLFFQSKIVNSFYSKINDSIRVRTSGSEAVGAGFESLSFQIFLRFRIVTLPPSIPLIHKIFRYQEFSETQNGSPTKFFDTETKSFERCLLHII